MSRNRKTMKGAAFIAMVMALVMFGAMAVPTEKAEAGLLDLGGGAVSSSLLTPVTSPLSGLLDPVLGVVSGLVGGVVNIVDDTVDNTLMYNLNVGGITGPLVAALGNTVCPTVNPILTNVVDPIMTSLSISTIQPLLRPVARVVDSVADLVVEDLVIGTVNDTIRGINEITGGEVKALIPMPLDPSRSCEDCHNSRTNLIAAMVDPANNLRYPGLAADVPFVDNFYVDPSYTTLPDSMMSKAVKHTLWNGCQTCHGTGETFDPFPSDNWVPDSNPNDGPETAWALGSTNNTSNSCGKCHADQANAVNNGIMGTHRGHLAAFNYNDVELESANPKSNYVYDPLGSWQYGTDPEHLPLDRNGKRVHAGYYTARVSCSTCHQGCSDCHMQGPGSSPVGILSALDILKGAQGPEIINVDQTHTAVAVRVKAFEAGALRRGGVSFLEYRKGYVPGVSRGVPYTVYEAGMDVATHRIVKPTKGEEGNTLAPQTQMQSIEFCWRCHFRTGAEYTGNWINIVPNVNYDKNSLGHLQAGMSCTDCHKRAESMGYTSMGLVGPKTISYQGTHIGTEFQSQPHPGGNPVGSTPEWWETPNPVKTTCGLCHTKEGKELGPTGGLNWGDLVTPKYQDSAKLVKGLAVMGTPGKTTKMSHANIRCEACHVQAMQNCWNCHLETSETVTGLPYIGTDDLSVSLDLPLGIGPINGPIVNVREAEGEPVLSDEENARLMEVPNQNEAATLALLLTFPGSPNTVNKAPRFFGRNNFGQVASIVHCPGNTPGPNNPTRSPQPTALDGGLYPVKADSPAGYGEVGAVSDILTAPEGSWFMEAGHSIARTPDGTGYTACYNCHVDTVRLGVEPITYYRKQPWVMQSVGAPEAALPASHTAGNSALVKNGSNWNCNCHGPAIVHNGTLDGPWPLQNVPEDQYAGPVDDCTTGQLLYGSKCSGCHGAIESSAKLGRTADQIEAAVNSMPAMSGLKGNLTRAEIEKIALALSGCIPGGNGGGTTIDGEKLYTDNCSPCHGALATSAKAGATFERIKWGLANVPSMAMPNLIALSDDEIHAISHALGGE